ncbi:MAG: hypothetical protein Q8N09_08440 [Thermodesulfovibrionia bacterium]|nr:hypothetical protein [Thermodesulfovibrionia bacterium]
MSFYHLEIIQFLIGLFIVIASYVFILYHRKPLLDYAFKDETNIRKSFAALTSMGYFLIFIPVLLVGINTTPPDNYSVANHIQRIIYFEAGLLFLVGILHMGIMTIFSTKMKFEKT